MNKNYNLNIKSMGEKIRIARNELNLTQERLGEEVGTSKTTIVNIENGSNAKGGNIELISKIAVVLNISLDELCGITSIPTESTEQEKKERIFNAIKSILDLTTNKFNISKDDFPFAEDSAELNIKIYDTGIAYFAQEYAKALSMIETNKDTEYYEDIKSAIMNGFESRFANMKNINDEYSFENKSYVFSESSGENITISLIDTPDEKPPF